MLFRTAVLCHDLNLYNNIIIYGTGDFSKEIYPYLIEHGLKEKIICFAQTKVDRNELLDEIPVMSLNEIQADKEKCVVLIAVSKVYENEIMQTLSEYEYPHMLLLTDYLFHYKWLEKDYAYLSSFEEYQRYMIDWCIRTNNEKPEKCPTKDEHLIVMVNGHLSARTIKIARALKKKKYDIIMLNCSDGANPWCLDELRKLNIQIYQCRCIAEMLYYAMQFSPLVYFVEPRWGDCLWTEIMFRNKAHLGKMVLSLYDVLNDGFAEALEVDLATEKYALENADGIVWRWFSKEYLEKKGFCFQGKSVQFLDYCDYEAVNDMRITSDSSVVKLCALAGYADEYIMDRTYTTQYCDWARVGEILEVVGNRKDCIFHFYAGFLNDDSIVQCRKYEQQYENFKFYLATEHNELLQRLKMYDFGCELYTDKKEVVDNAIIDGYYGSNFINSVCNKFFDFLNVGLPIVTTYPLKLCEYFAQFGFVVKMNLSNLDVSYLKQYREYYKEKVKKAKEELDIDNQIERLVLFFKEV